MRRCKYFKNNNKTKKLTIFKKNQIIIDNNKNTISLLGKINENNQIIQKRLLKENDKVFHQNIFFYKNNLLNSGKICKVFLGGCNNRKEFMAIKVINYSNNKEFDNHLEEKSHLVALKDKSNFPQMYDWDFSDKYIFIAESLMGPSLEELIDLCNNEIDINSAINIAIDLIEQIEVLHNSNILHCDIKSTNICYGNLSCEKDNMIRKLSFIDFGNSLSFKVKNKIIKKSNNNKPLCTREYASMNVLNGETNCRRDDLESIMLVVIKAYTKKLPWEKLDEYGLFIPFVEINNNDKSKINIKNLNIIRTQFKNIYNKIINHERLIYDELIFLHKNLTVEQKCAGLPEDFITIYKIINKLNYKDKPNYGLIQEILKNAKLKILKKENNYSEKYINHNDNTFEIKFLWEKLLYDVVYNKDYIINEKTKIKLEQIINKYCLNLKEYVSKIFNK